MFDHPVVYVDIETTGGSHRNSRVLEVAAIRVENGIVTKEYNQLLHPETYIPRQITALTGITESDVAGKPTFKDIAEDLYEILDGAVFIAHNVRFDYSFLKHEFASSGIVFRPRLLCTVRLSRALYPTLKGHSLATLIDRHNIPVLDRHRALADAHAIYYFAQLSYDKHGHEQFQQAIQKQLKSQYVPAHVDQDMLARIEDVPGVYIFRDEMHRPLYIGKSITLKKRIVSHFQDTHHREIAIAQATHHIETIPTGNELAALLLESKLVKDLLPLHNRKLRRVSQYAIVSRIFTGDYATVQLSSGMIDEATNLDDIYGIYPTRTKAKHRLDDITRTFSLCPKLMGLEKTSGACFSYSLGRCKGACTGKESAENYNQRFQIALQPSRLESWPYDGPIAIPLDESGRRVVIDTWIVQYYTNELGERVHEDIEPTFDMDEYKILKRFVRENKQHIVPVANIDEY